jgi:endonuclease/exonuclease/phosphatase family metal-dependent hydrolase
MSSIWRHGLAALAALLFSLSALACPVPDRVVPVSAADDHELTVVTQNLWRLVAAELSAEQQQARLRAWSRQLRDVLNYPHILVVQEVDTLAMLEALAAQVVADGGPHYRSLLIDGNDPSGIDVAVLVREPVQVGKVQALFARQRQGQHWLFSRPPLHVEIVAPIRFDLLALHLRSGHGLDDRQRAARVKSTREAQAKAVRRWAEARMVEGLALLLAGDLNSAPTADDYGVPLAILDRPPLWSAWQKVPEPERFSYIYRCQRQAIDHLLLSPSLRERVVRVEVSRGNAGRYRTLYGSGGAGTVVSDHDALKVYLRQ